MMSIKPVKIPGVGMRNVKTALAAAFCALAYYFIGRSPAFACIGAIFGMGSDMEDSRKNGGNRLFGTLIGGLLGMLLFRIYLIFKPDGAYTLWLVPLTFIGTVILIVLCQMVWVGGVQPGGIFCSFRFALYSFLLMTMLCSRPLSCPYRPVKPSVACSLMDMTGTAARFWVTNVPFPCFFSR